MGDVEGMVAEPRRSRLDEKRGWELMSQREDLAPARIVVASRDPFITNLDSIQGEPTLMIDPHSSSGVISPACIWVNKSF
jgi:hypothetical protein